MRVSSVWESVGWRAARCKMFAGSRIQPFFWHKLFLAGAGFGGTGSERCKKYRPMGGRLWREMPTFAKSLFQRLTAARKAVQLESNRDDHFILATPILGPKKFNFKKRWCRLFSVEIFFPLQKNLVRFDRVKLQRWHSWKKWMEKAIIILFTLRFQQQRHRSRFCFAYDIIGSLAAISSIVSTILIRSWKKVFGATRRKKRGSRKLMQKQFSLLRKLI